MKIILHKCLTEGESGQGLVEYSLIIVLIAIVIIGGLILFGGEVNDLYNKSLP